ncbi:MULTISPECIES: hypothetical protein [unclassified Vibrio]|uniref:hypothetical protein n=1 Tax=Vibrio TaxID=662 RepID=UPI00105473A5|nr:MULTISPECIES: hypothetical protein [Vibrio]NOH93640.1 hypothetical protein [Vibrio sp. AIC-3]TKF69118.1 hypothetical protein FCV55_12525 [Vibrio sp. F13]
MSKHTISRTSHPLANTISYTRFLPKLPLVLIAFSMPLFAEEVEEVVLEDEVVLNEGSELNEEAEESPYYNLCFSAYLWEVSRR